MRDAYGGTVRIPHFNVPYLAVLENRDRRSFRTDWTHSNGRRMIDMQDLTNTDTPCVIDTEACGDTSNGLGENTQGARMQHAFAVSRARIERYGCFDPVVPDTRELDPAMLRGCLPAQGFQILERDRVIPTHL